MHDEESRMGFLRESRDCGKNLQNAHGDFSQAGREPRAKERACGDEGAFARVTSVSSDLQCRLASRDENFAGSEEMRF